MISIIGRLALNPETMKTYSSDAAALNKKVAIEDGCVFYSLLVENLDEGIVSVAEIWRDEAALFVHWDQPWVTAFMEKYGAQVTGSTLKLYDLSNERDLPG